MEDQCTWNKIFRGSPRKVGWIEWTFRHRDVACRVDKARELFVGDDVPIHPEAIDSHFVDRTFLRIEII